MGADFLIDTNAGIDFLSGKLPPASTAWLEQVLDSQRLAMFATASYVGGSAD